MAAIADASVYSVQFEALLAFRKGVTVDPLGALSNWMIGHALSVQSSSSAARARSVMASAGLKHRLRVPLLQEAVAARGPMDSSSRRLSSTPDGERGRPPYLFHRHGIPPLVEDGLKPAKPAARPSQTSMSFFYRGFNL
jgi:hypothetical protein